MKARLYSSARRVRSRAGSSWSGPGPNGCTGRQAGRGRSHGQQGTEQVSGQVGAAVVSRYWCFPCWSSGEGVTPSTLSVMTEMFPDCIPA